MNDRLEQERVDEEEVGLQATHATMSSFEPCDCNHMRQRNGVDYLSIQKRY